MGARRQLEAREEHDAREWIGEIKVRPAGSVRRPLRWSRHRGAGQVFMARAHRRVRNAAVRGCAHGFLGEDPDGDCRR